MSGAYLNPGPSRDEIDASHGPIVLEFGTPWCGHCQAAAEYIRDALEDFSIVRHIKVEDGRGRPLGRSFHVKLWPTFVFLKDGEELARVVRPETFEELQRALEMICPKNGASP